MISIHSTLFGRQGLGGPPTKAILLWLGAYICNWLSGWLAIFLCLVVGFQTRFQRLVLPPLQLPCQKDQPGTDVLTHNCLPPLLSLCRYQFDRLPSPPGTPGLLHQNVCPAPGLLHNRKCPGGGSINYDVPGTGHLHQLAFKHKNVNTVIWAYNFSCLSAP